MLELEDIRAKMFYSIDFLQTFTAQSEITCFRDKACGKLVQLAFVNKHGLQGFWLKKSKKNRQRPSILAIFCISESVALISPNVANSFKKTLRGI